MTIPYDELQALARHTHRLLCSLNAPAVAPFLADWPDRIEFGGMRPHSANADADASVLPALRFIGEFADDDLAFGAPLVAAVCDSAVALQWRQSYTADAVGAAFLLDYAWTEILGPQAPMIATRIACGFLLLGPGTLYPRHRHDAEEIYVPLRGTARWQQGNAAWQERRPGGVIHHARQEAHAMHTGDAPLLALYLWRGDGLNQKARLEPANVNRRDLTP